jgi:hypothetical protein
MRQAAYNKEVRAHLHVANLDRHPPDNTFKRFSAPISSTKLSVLHLPQEQGYAKSCCQGGFPAYHIKLSS